MTFIVGFSLMAVGCSYFVGQGLQALHRRKVERQRAFVLLAKHFNDAPRATYGYTKAFPAIDANSENHKRMNYGLSFDNETCMWLRTPWADSKDWTGRR